MPGIRPVLIAVLLFLAGAALRAWNLALEGPDYYEAIARLILGLGPAEYTSALRIDFCPPLFYALYAPGVQAGLPIWLSRLTSVLVGAATPALLYLLTRGVVGGRAAFLGGLFLAINPMHVHLSQAAAPAAMGMALFVALLHYWFTSARSYKSRDWLEYDAVALALMYTHAGASAILFVLMTLHFAAVAAYRDPDGQRRVRRSRLLGQTAYHYVLIAVLSLPWILRMEGEVPWDDTYTRITEVLQFVTADFFLGYDGLPPWWLIIVVGLLALMLIPPVIGLATSNNFLPAAPLLMLLLGLGVLLGYDQVERMRFVIERDAPLFLPAATLALGILVANCNTLIRTFLTASLVLVFVGCTGRQLITLQNLQWREMTQMIKTTAGPDDLVVFWPDFTRAFGLYYLDKQGQQVAAATEVFERWAENPHEKNAVFVITDWPSKSDHLYTFPGALAANSQTQKLWQDGRNYLIRAENVNWTNLKLWFDAPETLTVLDQASSNTMFMFTPSDRIFRSEKFIWDEPALCYDENGRRSVWTVGEHTDIDLKVNLTPGGYVIRVHCSPILESNPAADGAQRRVTVMMRSGEERQRLVVDGETTIELPFTTDNDIKDNPLPLHISVSPTMRVREPAKADLGLKIYSISVDQEYAPEAPLTF